MMGKVDSIGRRNTIQRSEVVMGVRWSRMSWSEKNELWAAMAPR